MILLTSGPWLLLNAGIKCKSHAGFKEEIHQDTEPEET